MTDKQKGENGNMYSWGFSGRAEHVAVHMDVFRELWPPPLSGLHLSPLPLCALLGPASPEV